MGSLGLLEKDGLHIAKTGAEAVLAHKAGGNIVGPATNGPFTRLFLDLPKRHYYKVEDDFDGGSLDETNGLWTIDAIAGTNSFSLGHAIDSSFGEMYMTSESGSGKGDNLHTKPILHMGEVSRAREFWFSMRCAFTATDGAVLIGLINAVVDVFGAGLTDAIAFKRAAGGACTAVCTRNSTTTSVSIGAASSAADPNGLVYKDYSIYFDGTYCHFFVDDVLKASIQTNIPYDEPLAISFAYKSGGAYEAVATIDYALLISRRP